MSRCICYEPEAATFNRHSVIACLPADRLPITHSFINLGKPASESLYAIVGQMGSSRRELLYQPVTFFRGLMNNSAIFSQVSDPTSQLKFSPRLCEASRCKHRHCTVWRVQFLHLWESGGSCGGWASGLLGQALVCRALQRAPSWDMPLWGWVLPQGLW